LDAIAVRSISREYRIRTQSVELANLLAFIEARPEIGGTVLSPVEMAAEAVPEGFRVTLPDGEKIERSFIEAANRLHEAVFTGVLVEAPGAPLVHGASLLREGQRFILIGPKGAGKSTLTLHLLAHGFDVEGDEHVVLRESDLIARPRRMRVKPGALPLVPELAEAVLSSPVVENPIEGRVHAVDPSIAGRPWRIRPGRADHLVFLEANHGGASSLRAIGQDETFQRLAADCLLPRSGQAGAPEGVRLSALLADPEAAGATVTMQWRPGHTVCREVRLFRNDPRIRFRGLVYESILEGLEVVCDADGLVIRDTPVRIDHLGYEGDLTLKHRRNLGLLRRAVEDQPDNPFYWSRLGESLAALGEPAEAVQACRKAIELACGSGADVHRGEVALAHQTLARLMAEAGEPPEKVLESIDGGLAARPEDHALRFARARALIEARRYEEALAILDSLVAKDPPTVRQHSVGYDLRLFREFAHDQRGVALLRLGRFGEAAAAFEAAAAAAPDDPAYRAKAVAMRGHAARTTRRAS
jgi:Flp pilus assembly protein TadD